MGDKPFVPVGGQIEILKRRGVAFADERDAERFLLKEGYYAVVNGYKDAFVDKQASDIAGEDRYSEGTTFDMLKQAYLYDRRLRAITAPALLEAEAALKTALVYAFCEVHPGGEDYLDSSSYCARSSLERKKLEDLLLKLQRIRANKRRKEYIEHYARTHGFVPLWVAARVMTFGTLSAFYDRQQDQVKTRAHIALARSLGKKSVKGGEVVYALRTLPTFRNVCAHDERLYCARAGKNSEKRFAQMLRGLESSLEKERYESYRADLKALVDELGETQPALRASFLKGMGMDDELL